jgi:hypothetical protein
MTEAEAGFCVAEDLAAWSLAASLLVSKIFDSDTFSDHIRSKSGHIAHSLWETMGSPHDPDSSIFDGLQKRVIAQIESDEARLLARAFPQSAWGDGYCIGTSIDVVRAWLGGHDGAVAARRYTEQGVLDFAYACSTAVAVFGRAVRFTDGGASQKVLDTAGTYDLGVAIVCVACETFQISIPVGLHPAPPIADLADAVAALTQFVLRHTNDVFVAHQSLFMTYAELDAARFAAARIRPRPFGVAWRHHDNYYDASSSSSSSLPYAVAAARMPCRTNSHRRTPSIFYS